MKTSDFNYPLPEDLIARYPAQRRDESRLMLLERTSGELHHEIFKNIRRYLKPGDLLALNDSRVIPARLIGRKAPYGGQVEIFLLQELQSPGLWKALVRPGKKIKKTDRIIIEPRVLECTILDYAGKGERIVQFEFQGDWWNILDQFGHTPLPPYILKARKQALEEKKKTIPWEEHGDRERYQTVFAHSRGSVAAPTAGLHFTQALLDELREMDVEIIYITLHVGAGTFKPVESETIENHQMEKEYYVIDEQTAHSINRARMEKRRIIAVGTTVVRVLETVAAPDGRISPATGETDLMIIPGYRFKAVDAMLTNFHLPRSTLLMLVAAFAGHDRILEAYRIAVQEKYRFYSYGDAMFIV